MQVSWGIFVIAGLTWATTAGAYDVDDLAKRVLSKMNGTAPSQVDSYTLPGFMISLSRYSATWNVQNGRAVSTGTWSKYSSASMERLGNHLYMTVPLSIDSIRTNYTFYCSDSLGRSGTYEMTSSWSYKGLLKVRIGYSGPFDCDGAVHSIDVQGIPNCISQGPSFRGDDIDGRSDSCAYESWSGKTEFLGPFAQHFCESYQEAIEKLAYSTAAKALEGFNLCPI